MSAYENVRGGHICSKFEDCYPFVMMQEGARNGLHEVGFVREFIRDCRALVHKGVQLALKATELPDEQNQRFCYLTGCSARDYVLHVTRQMEPRMFWQTHGGPWQIDHIRPVCSFAWLTSPSLDAVAREAFNYKNVRPLWTFLNLKRKRCSLLNSPGFLSDSFDFLSERQSSRVAHVLDIHVIAQARAERLSSPSSVREHMQASNAFVECKYCDRLLPPSTLLFHWYDSCDYSRLVSE
eukprot:gnl/Hemi2/3109_TR1101_c0_g1_i1.p1 gnl/Hemi2/3109_TR1101_c0_g1~~gnl/Hemi2/3109_TR1101_c0_g1_i1.p1  ORF type:complete len:238 (-),score=15.26 gnl/Hemi2/3109_TR1101_c0_g1_i1:150-863(-)